MRHRWLPYGGLGEGYHFVDGSDATWGETIANPHHEDTRELLTLDSRRWRTDKYCVYHRARASGWKGLRIVRDRLFNVLSELSHFDQEIQQLAEPITIIGSMSDIPMILLVQRLNSPLQISHLRPRLLELLKRLNERE